MVPACIAWIDREGEKGWGRLREGETAERERLSKQRQATKQKGRSGNCKGQVERDSNRRAGGKRSTRE
jgi:hypothetical protein